MASYESFLTGTLARMALTYRKALKILILTLITCLSFSVIAYGQSNDKAEIDTANAADGYFRARNLKTGAKALKVMVKTPSGANYTYNLKTDGSYEVFPFSDGDGSYTIGVYEQVEGTKYATMLTVTETVKLTSEFVPFLRPNQFVNYSGESATVLKSAELCGALPTTMEKITAVYNFVVGGITYDTAMAANVAGTSGYVPNVDAVLAKGSGICFDYAAVMAAMLRSQNIPTKLIVGYSGEIYHAWLSVYSSETGWINNVIQFDGTSWKLMDPTFASTGAQSAEVMQYIGDGKNYTGKYTY